MDCSGNRGSVLILVLIVMVAATALIMESMKVVRIGYNGASSERVLVTGGSLLRSGLVVAEETLLDDVKLSGGASDDAFDNWAHIDRLFDKLSSGLSSGEIHGAITDEDGRIPLNSLLKGEDVGDQLGEIFVRLVGALCRAHSIDADPESYLRSIRIWLGNKDVSGDGEWYASREPGYAFPASPFRSPDELLLVRWGNLAPEIRRKIYYGSDGIPGLRDFVTVWGDGLINVNTASPRLLAAICPQPELRADFVQAAEDYRRQGANQRSSSWVLDVARMVGLDMSRFPTKAVGVRSSYFRVELAASVGAGRLASTTVLRRESNRCVVLFQNTH